MMKLSNLLGWKLSDGFNELDLFDYLTSPLRAAVRSGLIHLVMRNTWAPGYWDGSAGPAFVLHRLRTHLYPVHVRGSP